MWDAWQLQSLQWLAAQILMPVEDAATADQAGQGK